MAEQTDKPPEPPPLTLPDTLPEGAVCYRFFVSYTGIKLPVRMVNPLEEVDLKNRNTFIIAYFDKDDRMVGFEKMVYGEIELSHFYDYYPSGALQSADIMMDEVVTTIDYDESGAMITEA